MSNNKKKLKAELLAKLNPTDDDEHTQPVATCDTSVSRYFPVPFWKRFLDIECELNEELRPLKFDKITHVYNPIEYAKDLHSQYLKRFLQGQKKMLLIGMNPGPNGMAQNGVPFGNTKTVRYLMKIEGNVDQPSSVHPKRPVTGLACTTEEPSGNRIWTLIENLSGSLDVFSRQCFLHNFCPLAFFDIQGRNITPGELKGVSKSAVRDICLKHLDKQIQLLQPDVIVSVGTYVEDCIKKLFKQEKYIGSNIKLFRLGHPSPRSVNNNNWPEKATQFFKVNNLMKYLRNEN